MSTLVISKSKGLSEIPRDIRAWIYQIFRIEENINQTITVNKWICNLTPEVKSILKILWKRGEIAPEEQFLFSSIFCYLLLEFHGKTGTRFSLRGKQLFEISSRDNESRLYLHLACRVKTSVDNILKYLYFSRKIDCQSLCYGKNKKKKIINLLSA